MLSSSSTPKATLHTVFSAECNPIFDWHSIALFHSHKVSGQAGGITRLLACSKEQLRNYNGLDIGPTFVHHNHRTDEGMNYAAFNKPASVNYWVHSGAVPPGVEYVMQLDADMLVHRPIDPFKLGVRPGVVLSAPYDYLIGTATGLADVFGVKNKHLQARVGGVHVFHVDDLRRIAPLWLNFTERVRDFSCREPQRYYELAAPQAKASDHSDEAKGRRRQFMWMVEMYGYVFGAAEAGIGRHIISNELMRYTGDVLHAPGPYVVHYGIDWNVKWDDPSGATREYGFNKLLYLSLDAASCPAWFFPLPPYASQSAPSPSSRGAIRRDHPAPHAWRALCVFPIAGRATVVLWPVETLSELVCCAGGGPKHYRDAKCGWQIATFNAALCEYYGRHCHAKPSCPPPDGELARREPGACVDLSQNCLSWARRGECQSNPGFMRDECLQSCGLCSKRDAHPFLGAPAETCVDMEPKEVCASLVALGACSTQRAYTQEACRRSCQFCNASKDAFPEGIEPQKDDTAAHACPDGSDLGGGEVMVASRNPKKIAAEVDGAEQRAQAGSVSPPRRAPSRTASLNEMGSQMHAETDLERMARRTRRLDGNAPSSSREERLMLDAMLVSWPFFLVQGLVLVLLGYMLRGCQDHRRRHKASVGRANNIVSTPSHPSPRRRGMDMEPTWGSRSFGP